MRVHVQRNSFFKAFQVNIYSELPRFGRDDRRRTRSNTSFGFLATRSRSTWYHSLVLLRVSKLRNSFSKTLLDEGPNSIKCLQRLLTRTMYQPPFLKIWIRPWTSISCTKGLVTMQLTLKYQSSVVHGNELPLSHVISFTMYIQGITRNAIDC